MGYGNSNQIHSRVTWVWIRNSPFEAFKSTFFCGKLDLTWFNLIWMKLQLFFVGKIQLFQSLERFQFFQKKTESKKRSFWNLLLIKKDRLICLFCLKLFRHKKLVVLRSEWLELVFVTPDRLPFLSSFRGKLLNFRDVIYNERAEGRCNFLYEKLDHSNKIQTCKIAFHHAVAQDFHVFFLQVMPEILSPINSSKLLVVLQQRYNVHFFRKKLDGSNSNFTVFVVV